MGLVEQALAWGWPPGPAEPSGLVEAQQAATDEAQLQDMQPKAGREPGLRMVAEAGAETRANVWLVLGLGLGLQLGLRLLLWLGQGGVRTRVG